jgi:hypothetical protein
MPSQPSILLLSFRRVLAVLLASMLALSAADKPSPLAIAMELPDGAMVRIKTIQKATLEGRYLSRDDAGITIQSIRKNRTDKLEQHVVAFSDIQSLQHTNKPWSTRKTTIVSLLSIWAILTAISAAIGG